MATLGSTNIASSYYQVKVGGDGAALSGIMKALGDMAVCGDELVIEYVQGDRSVGITERPPDFFWMASSARLVSTGPQSVTVEDSMSMVHASRGTLPPAPEYLLSEPAIVAGMARATLPNSNLRLDGLTAIVFDIAHGSVASLKLPCPPGIHRTRLPPRCAATRHHR